MKKIILLLFPLLLLSMHAGKKKITVFLAGDSTMAYKPRTEHPERGWGMMLGEFFTEKVHFDNRAKNGRSTKTFLSEGLWEGIMADVQKGDYVVIQFGHNDSSKEKGERYTTPEQYRDNLKQMVEATRAKKAHPILCTPVMRRRFDKEGNFYDVHGEYPEVVRQLAKDLGVPLVDMHRSSEAVVVAHGPEDSKQIFLHIPPGAYEILPEGLTDNTHFSAYGARLMAQLFAEGLKKQPSGLSKYLKKAPGK
jgi:DNA sulfur modification protein DndE